MATINHTISVSPEFHTLAEDFHISWSEAAKIGMAVKLQEAGAMNKNELTRERIQKAINSTLQQKKFVTLQNLVKDMSEKISELEGELKNKKNDTT